MAKGNIYKEPGVMVVEVSDNAKLGLMSCTYAADSSCPQGCPLRGNGCYGEYGPMSIHWKRISLTPELAASEIALNEAKCIEQLSGQLDLRLHVVGDSTTRKGTRAIARASSKVARRRGRKVFGYTHASCSIPRKDWGDVSMLASCERMRDVEIAHARGYATALVVPAFEQQGAYELGKGFKLIPCPWQTRKISCSNCRLCLNDTRLRDNKLVIGFEPHGAGAKRLLRTLELVAA